MTPPAEWEDAKHYTEAEVRAIVEWLADIWEHNVGGWEFEFDVAPRRLKLFVTHVLFDDPKPPPDRQYHQRPPKEDPDGYWHAERRLLDSMRKSNPA